MSTSKQFEVAAAVKETKCL